MARTSWQTLTHSPRERELALRPSLLLGSAGRCGCAPPPACSGYDSFLYSYLVVNESGFFSGSPARFFS